MKLGFLCFLLGLLLLNASAFGELSVEDYEKIRGIVKEIVTAESEKTNARIDGVIGKIEGVNGRIYGIEKQLDRNFALILALMALIGVIIGLPQLREWKKAREQGRQIAVQQEQIAVQQEQIAAQQEQIAAQQQQIDELHRKVEALTQGGPTVQNVGAEDVPRSS